MTKTSSRTLVAARLLALSLFVACASGCEALVGAAVVGVVAPVVVPVVVGAAVNATNPAVRVDPELAAAVTARVPIYTKDDPEVAEGEKIGDASAISCERMPEDPPASEEEARVKLRLVAEQAGGNAVILDNCDARGNVSFTKNCYTWVRCEGFIVRMTVQPGEAAGVESSQ